MMDFSDDEDIKIQQQVNAFRHVIPNKKKGHVGGQGKIKVCESSKRIKDECEKLMNEILSVRIQDTVKRICDTIVQNRTQTKSIVIVLNIRRNQKKDLLKFVQMFASYDFKPKKSLKTIAVQQLNKEDVRDLALQIQMKQDRITQKILYGQKDQQKNKQNDKQIQQDEEQIHRQTHLILYVNRKVTNLDQSNIHVFDGSVIKANYAAIIPTFENLKIVDGLGITEQNQMFYFQAYNNKNLFIQFFYRCLVSKTIMAYLPKQILGLIKLYDYYPLSYQQGCNMLIYACQTFDALCKEMKKPQKLHVDIKELIRIFNRTWKIIWSDQMQVARYNFYQLSHVILDENANYKVPQKKILNFIRMNSAKDTGVDDLNEKNFYKKFLNRFRDKIEGDQNLKPLSKFFDDYEDRKAKYEIKKMKKNARQISLGFQNKSLKSEKQQFEDKITYFFKQATAEIRRQAKYVEWKDLKVFEMFQPQLVKDTLDGILQDSQFRDVFNTIRSTANCPMGRLIEKFKGIQIGRLIYIIRCLELKGLVELTKHTLRPSLVTNFYDKAKFRMSGNE